MGSAPAMAGELVHDTLGGLVGRIHALMPSALADEPDAVHQLRTAVRRLRSVLAAFRRHLDRERADALRSSLADFLDVLGRPRDLEVRADLATGAVVELGLPDGVRDRLAVTMLRDHRAAHEALVAWCAGRDFAALREELDRWVQAPPFSEKADMAARKAARRAVRRQADRTLDTVRDVDVPLLVQGASQLSEEDVAHAHDLRKAARRLRHTVDAVTDAGLLERRAGPVGAAGHRVQSVLGDHRDLVLLARHARELAGAAEEAGEPRAPYDAVVARSLRVAHDAVTALPEALDELRAARAQL